MKQLLAYVILLMLVLQVPVRAIAVPDWKAQVDKINTAVAGLNETMASDLALYKILYQQVSEIRATFSVRKKLREDVFACVKGDWQDLQKGLATCGADSDKLSKKLDLDRLSLEAKLESLKQSTQKEIAALKDLKAKATVELATIQKTFDDVAGDSKDAAQAIVKTLQTLQNTYDSMISERNAFLGELDGLLKEIAVDRDREIVDLQNVRNTVSCA